MQKITYQLENGCTKAGSSSTIQRKYVQCVQQWEDDNMIGATKVDITQKEVWDNN